MAFAAVGTLGSVNSVTANQSSLVLTTSATLEVGNFAVLGVAVENSQTTDGDEGAVSSVTDSAGNSWSKAGEFCNGQGAAQAGATISVWTTVATSQLTSGGTITANFTNATSRDAAAAFAHEFTIATSSVTVGGTQTLAVDAGDIGTAITLSGLSSAARLWFRAQGIEGRTGLGTATAGWTKTDEAIADTAVATTSMVAAGEFIIATATSETSDPGSITTRDSAILLIAFEEVSAASSTSGNLLLLGAG